MVLETFFQEGFLQLGQLLHLVLDVFLLLLYILSSCLPFFLLLFEFAGNLLLLLVLVHLHLLNDLVQVQYLILQQRVLAPLYFQFCLFFGYDILLALLLLYNLDFLLFKLLLLFDLLSVDGVMLLFLEQLLHIFEQQSLLSYLLLCFIQNIEVCLVLLPVNYFVFRRLRVVLFFFLSFIRCICEDRL